MKRKILKVSAFVLAALTIMLAGFTVAAEVPYTSYTYWSELGAERKEVYNRPMYTAGEVVDANRLGIKPFTSLKDICTDNSGNIYLLDSTSRIVVLNKEYKLLYEIGLINNTEKYDNATSLYVHTDGTLYICDTEGGRVLQTDKGGKLLKKIGLPESQLIPDDYQFRPMRMAVDKMGYTYILSDGSYYGALLYDANETFLGFYGANMVTSGIAGVLTNIVNRVFPNNVKKGKTAQKIPFCFNDIKTDSDGFVYTCNGYTEKWGNSGQIRKLSPGTSKNILGSSDVNFVDTKMNTVHLNGAFSSQDIMNIEIDKNGFIYSLESAYGKVFLYDQKSRIITSFGGGMHEGTQNGTFINVSGMALLDDGNTVLVSDSAKNSFTSFKLNEYGKSVKGLITLTLKGEYEEAREGWEEVLRLDDCFQPAYSGIANAYLNDGNYKKAMEYAKLGYDRNTYAIAYEYYRNDFINSNFTLIFFVLITVIVGAIVLLAISMRRKVNIIRNKEIKFLTGMLVHPSDTFAAVKEKGMGSLPVSAALLVLFYLSVVLNTIKGGFLFTKYDPEGFNSLWVLVRTVGLAILWIASNWMVCTLMGGRGKLREITIVTSYSLLPIIIENFISLILSNVLLPNETSFLTIINTVATIYFVLLMICGLLKIHDFSFGRMVSTSVLSILGIAIIAFLMIMIIMLFQQTYGFIATVASELLTL